MSRFYPFHIECTWFYIIGDEWVLTRVWFNGKSITQHGTGKEPLSRYFCLFLPLQASRRATNEIQCNTETKYTMYCKRNTIAPHKCCIPLTVGGAKSALVLRRKVLHWAEKFCTEQKSFALRSAFVSLKLPPPSSSKWVQALTSRFICPKKWNVCT